MTMLTSLGIGAAGIYALLGYAVVFFGLILLMIVVMIMGKAFTAKKAAPAATKVTRKIIGRQDVVQLPEGSVLRVPSGSQITQLAMDIIRVNKIQVVRE